ncbi:hypothetical protein [uncultured Draconibacterium sp.]|uniref:hypothetical protein n=1 Tax=uncultured Draconibacterium sp. TaxID=1573823 RepID=UPI00261537EC|nr:hypothetical protein [uncultured Draconibacterium sp.]
MKKYIYLLSLISLVFVVSCSDNEDEIIQADVQMEQSENIVLIPEDGIEPDSLIESIVASNPDAYVFEDSHSELWTNENLKSTTTTSLSVEGYDMKQYLSSFNTMFLSGLSCDSRIKSNITYLVKKYRYKKSIQIPKGATLILPPESYMGTMSPMGYLPGTSNYGYSYELISSGNVYDTYYLMTEGSEIVYNIYGQQLFSLDNPVYIPCKVQTPHDIIFKYQYSVIEW